MDSSLSAVRPGQTTIRHLRFVCHERDGLATQALAPRWLAEAEFSVPGLPPGAILCIRRVADPLARRWTLPRGQVATAPQRWSQAVAETLAQAAQRAARPVDLGVAAHAEAVLFADPAEVLACLAQDWLEGSVVTRWWWQSLLGESLMQGATGAVVAAWLNSARAGPAALQLLARRQLARPFVEALPNAAAPSLLVSVAQAFGLRGIVQAVSATSRAEWDSSMPWPDRRPAPWTSWTPEVVQPGLSRSQAALLGLALGLERAQTVVRSAAFAHDVAVWMAGQQDAPAQVDLWPSTSPDPWSTDVLPSEHSPAITNDPLEQPKLEGPTRQPLPMSLSTDDFGRAVRMPDADFRPVAELGPIARPAQGTVESARDARGGDRSPETGSDRRQPIGDAARTSFLDSEPPDLPVVATDAVALRSTLEPPVDENVTVAGREHWVHPSEHEADGGAQFQALAEPVEVVLTSYGGVFFLVSLGLYLGLYADFSAPLAPGIELNPYDFLALVGERLAGEGLRSDPIWALLARLAGRGDDEPPGANFTPPDGLSLETWLEALLATLRTRLHQALGTSDEDPSELAHVLVARPARLLVTATRLDVFFALDDHPIQIRLSGLDRDPGWVPAAGRIVAFHFE